MTLPRDLARLARDHVDAMLERVESLGLRLRTEYDFGELKRLVRSVPGLFLYPAFDPDEHLEHVLTAENAFWFRITDAATGDTVAWHADRVIESRDFSELLASGAVWRTRSTALTDGERRLQSRRVGMRPICGRTAHAGSLWVAPSHRKRGLSSILPSLSRAVCLLEHDVDHHTGLVFEHLARSQLPTAGYGYPHVELWADGYFPPTGRNERVFLCHISREETLASFAQNRMRVRLPELRAAA